MEEFEVQNVARGVLLKNGKPVGMVVAESEEYGVLEQHLRDLGYDASPAAHAEDGAIEYEQVCTLDNPRPCEVNVTLNQIDDLAREAGLSHTPVDAVIAQGRFTEEQAAEAIKQTIAEMPAGELRENAEMWYEAAFGEGSHG